MVHSNCHTHTIYCDGKRTAEDMVKAAIEKGFYCLGFSVHSPMKSNADWTIKSEKLAEYVNEIKALQKKYADKIEILNGIELDSAFCNVDVSEFDYVIGSVHQFNCGGRIYDIDYTAEMLMDCCKKEFGGDLNKMAEAYYNSLCSFVCKQKPQVVGHYDLIEKFNDKGELFDDTDAEYQQIALKYADRILEECPDIFFEVNTGAMFRCGNMNPYPAFFILKHLAEKNAKIVITSDAHCTEALDFQFEKVIEICKKAGFDCVYELRKSGFEKTEI